MVSARNNGSGYCAVHSADDVCLMRQAPRTVSRRSIKDQGFRRGRALYDDVLRMKQKAMAFAAFFSAGPKLLGESSCLFCGVA